MAQSERVSVELVAIGSCLCASDEIFKIGLDSCVYHLKLALSVLVSFEIGAVGSGYARFHSNSCTGFRLCRFRLIVGISSECACFI